MNLWIRSQDKRIMLSNPKLAIIPIGDVVNGYNYEIYDTSSYNQNTNLRYGWLGIYRTEERALEVLDEIQAELILMPDEADLRGLKLEQLTDNIVYEMPKE